MTPSLPTPSRGATNFALVLLCLIWGSTWLVIADGLKSLPPLTSLAARSLVAAGVMSLAARWLLRFDRGEAPPWRLALAVGSLQLGLSYMVVYVSETVLTSGLASLLWAVFPIFVAIGSHFFLAGERLRPAQWFGFLVGFVGVGVLFVRVLGAIDTRAILFGLLLLTSPLISTVSTIVAKRHAARVSSVLLNRNALYVAATLHVLAAFVFERDARAEWTPRAVASVVYLAVFGTAIAFGLYFWLLRAIPAHRMSLISYVNPAIALLLGWAVGKEPVSTWTIAGSALILLGVYMVVRGHAPAVRAPRAPPASAAAACEREPATRDSRLGERMTKRTVRAVTALCAALAALAATFPLWRTKPPTGPVVLKDNTTASETLLRRRAADPHDDPPLWEPLDVADVPALYGAPDEERLADPLTGFVYRPNHARRVELADHPDGHFEKRTNSLGFAQDDELSPARDFLVLVGGDSHADGLCANRDTFSSRCRDTLRELHPELAIDVANAAEAGYAFHQYLGLLHKFQDLRPDVYVVAIYTGNDVLGTVKMRHYFARTMPPPHTLEYFKDIRRAQKISTGAVANALNQLLYFHRYPEELEPSLDNALALCAELEGLARERGVDVLYVTIPTCLEASGVGDEKLAELKRELALDGVWDHFEVVTDRLVAGLRARGADVTDLREHFREPRKHYYWTDLHINVEGQKLVAELLAPKLDAALTRRRH